MAMDFGISFIKNVGMTGNHYRSLLTKNRHPPARSDYTVMEIQRNVASTGESSSSSNFCFHDYTRQMAMKCRLASRPQQLWETRAIAT